MAPVGVLLMQLGTPDAPTATAVRRYLREFLSDPRVIELPRALWLPILWLGILPFRSRASAAKYRRIWSPEDGSPLLHWTSRQRTLLAGSLGDGYRVAFGMRYGQPSIADAVTELVAAGVERLIALALYPQYSAASTGSACDALFTALSSRRNMPAISIVPPYFADAGYIDALRDIATADDRAFEHTLISFHSIPVAMTAQGDPYRHHCEATANRLAAALDLQPNSWTLTFQSRFGRSEWLGPQTEATMLALASAGTRRVRIITPGFTADCLETIDELGYEARLAFEARGGTALIRIPCLNDHPRWITALRDLAARGHAANIGDHHHVSQHQDSPQLQAARDRR